MCRCCGCKVKFIVGRDGYTPEVGEEGTWIIGGVDTRIRAVGLSPHIGENGNWWIGDVDTGVSARGLPAESSLLFSMQARDLQGTLVGVVPFDTTIINNTEGVIEYTDNNQFVINSEGNYGVFWQVSFNADSVALSVIKFGIFIGGVEYASMDTALPAAAGKGQLSGSTLFEITDIPIVLNLSNISGETLKLLDADVQANINIVKFS